MAVLSTQQLRGLRNQMERRQAEVSYGKADINSALQAIEDWFEAERANLSAAIDAGTAHAFTNPQKKLLVGYWLGQKMTREV